VLAWTAVDQELIRGQQREQTQEQAMANSTLPLILLLAFLVPQLLKSPHASFLVQTKYPWLCEYNFLKSSSLCGAKEAPSTPPHKLLMIPGEFSERSVTCE
jgi:hypothetical protein